MSWKIDPVHSQIEFSVKHMMITTVRGQFKSFDGVLNLDPDSPAVLIQRVPVCITAPVRCNEAGG